MSAVAGRPGPPPFEAPSADVQAGIRETIADYYLGWYDADAERMARALHPALVKRGWAVDEPDGQALEPIGFRWMVDAAGAGRGRRTDPAERVYEVGPIAVYDDVASAPVHAVPYIDYLHLVRTPDGWRIVHALWRRP